MQLAISFYQFRYLLAQSLFRLSPCCSGSRFANNLSVHLSPAARMTCLIATQFRETALVNLQSWLKTTRHSSMEFAYPDIPLPTGGLYTTTFDPATDKPLVHCQVTTKDDLDGIVKAASIAQKEWISIGPLERGKVMHKAAECLRQNAAFVAELETLDTGKPYWEALADVQACADSIDLFAGFVPTIAGTYVPVPPNDGSFYYTRREPFGVCGGIGAWNFPLQMAVWKSAPALAAGNALVFKPSPLTPMSAFYLRQVYLEAGCPPHLFSVVNGEAEVGQALVQHPSIAKVSFTGSVGGGQAVLAAAAKRVIPGTVELGGKSPLIIFQDADLDEAVKGTLMANYYTQGEVCSNAARVFVHRPIFDSFLQKLLAAVERLHLGDPFSPLTCMGALISPQHSETVRAYIKQAIGEGATLEAGGDQPVSWPEGSPLSSTNFVRPCVLTQCSDDMTAVKEEIFGPVITLLPFDDEEEVISRANNSCLGLAGGVFTQKLTTAHRVAAQLQCGSVYINSYNLYPPGIPFGGYKMSGFGRENGLETLNSYTQVKAVYVEGGKLPEPFPS